MSAAATERMPRAKPLPVEERRAAIARATVPLLIAHGGDVTTRQIAEASGVAEGTLFRVFPDKDAIIDAAVEAFLDPAPFRAGISAIDPTLPLELKVQLVLERFRERFSGIFGVFASLGVKQRPPIAPDIAVIVGIFERLLAPDLERLRIPPARVFGYIRLVAFSSAMPHLAADLDLDTAELAHLVVHGIARHTESESTTCS
ncbi:TetR/AcrR family transcriptional regulator [Agromyces intestinalis]|uniref:TetR/AcrR family transcriptional regulator n=1 Tax=Agromyces intestinalis TaxID=2592652 RepID=A0A5C1YJP1_9MICO|nr:TetR/AcrR family transcriptional regulator [Agromyces intestinalis]QEO15480.1 TetR/AcrR family transcriptional regulator [Agromyces intestinalis]